MTSCEDVQMDAGEVCRLLDMLAVEMLELMEQQLEAKARLVDCMKEGFLNLAKARYTCGNTSISALQLPCREQEVEARARVRMEDGSLLLCADGRDDKAADPLQWFGVLVPRNLRRAQSDFCGALDWAVDGANVQLRLQRCQERYLELLKVKSELTTQ